ncbi:permease prefix domain 1-containing protein [Nonomuraea sp. H19]|uniref:permease prefix domain 1-containing protein n=1 Tax=Nonomuraea sp. H19 TaxID=3452206 RepID=UPI003F8C0E4E
MSTGKNVVIDDYVKHLSRTLKGPPRPKRDFLTEARDSLLDAADALEKGGLRRVEAERVAVREFGTVGELASGYQRELSLCPLS